MKGIDTLKNKCLVAFFSFMLVGDIWRKPLIELTKLAKISCKAFSYGVIPDPFLNLRSSKKEEMKRIDTPKNLLTSSNIFAYVAWKYLKTTFHCTD